MSSSLLPCHKIIMTKAKFHFLSIKVYNGIEAQRLGITSNSASSSSFSCPVAMGITSSTFFFATLSTVKSDNNRLRNLTEIWELNQSTFFFFSQRNNNNNNNNKTNLNPPQKNRVTSRDLKTGKNTWFRAEMARGNERRSGDGWSIGGKMETNRPRGGGGYGSARRSSGDIGG